MKVALYIADGLEQIVLTPDSDLEKAVLSKMSDSTRSLEFKTGSFYETQGGWLRQGVGDHSTMIVSRPKA